MSNESLIGSPEWNELMRGSVITEDGKPFPESRLKKVFHGTSKQFEFFQSAYLRGEVGLHAGSSEVAHKRLHRDDIGEFEKDSRLYPLFFNIKRPLFLHDRIEWEITHLQDKADIAATVVRDIFISKGVDMKLADSMMYIARAITGQHYGHTEESLRTDIIKIAPENGNEFLDTFLGLFREMSPLSEVEDVIEWMERQGYDGIAYLNVMENYRKEEKDLSYIAFRPEQVRSAITGEQLWRD